VLLPLVTLPRALATLKDVFKSEGRALNPLLGRTAQLVFVFGLLFAIGIALGATGSGPVA
jgi:1,4-dihydroxy-2-naphthoate octaprenyltransferase